MVLGVDGRTIVHFGDFDERDQRPDHRQADDLRQSRTRAVAEQVRAISGRVFSAYIGQMQSGAALVPGTNTELTFNGGTGLTLAVGADAYSDPLTFQVMAFTRYAVSLDVTTAADISGHDVGPVTNYMAVGAHAADPTASSFTAVPAVPD